MNGVFQGVPAAGGRGAGRVYLFARRPLPQSSPQSLAPQNEWQRFTHAHNAVVTELRADDPNAATIDGDLRAAHLLILEDPTLIDAIRTAIEERGLRAIPAVQETISALSKSISALDDPYFAARAADVRDAGGRLLAALSGVNPDAELDTLPPETILVVDDLTPSQVARLDASLVRGIVLRRGSPLAHAAILARSMGIAMVCAVRELNVAAGDVCLVDGDAGTVATNVAPETCPPDLPSASLLQHEERRTDVEARLLGNANNLADLGRIRLAGLSGVGLLRTEFLFPRHVLSPTLDEQTALFASLIAAAPDGIFTVRALDAGGDKEIPWLSTAHFPAMIGRRGVRLLLGEPDLLRTQYRALLRALRSAARPSIAPRYLLPMVTSAEEVVRVRALLDEVAREEMSAPIALGAMIEAPAAVFGAHEIAQVSDFLSIGTNDLAHFLFATDRTHADPDHLADPLHPAVLRAIAMTCDAARSCNIPVAVCGEMAGNPHATPLLVGLGVSELSLRATSASLVHAALGEYTQEQCREMAQQALAIPL